MRQGMHFLINNSLKRKGKKKKKREILNKKMSRNQCSKIENGSSNNTVGIFDQFFTESIHIQNKKQRNQSKKMTFPQGQTVT